MTFRPAILVVSPSRELRWRGRFFLPAVLDGEHYFQIMQLAPDRIRFIHDRIRFIHGREVFGDIGPVCQNEAGR